MVLARVARRAVDITAARTHRIATTREHLKIPALANKAYQGPGGTVCTPFKRHRGHKLTTTQKAVNRARSRLRSPIEGAFARLKTWHIFHRARCSPNHLTSMTWMMLPMR
ncbi:DDE superfamily endonuclease [Streptomyces noursei ATCC 11455]|nr:DDE superfamily endonuclease [Streptomyces noursei ATCC 11455]